MRRFGSTVDTDPLYAFLDRHATRQVPLSKLELNKLDYELELMGDALAAVCEYVLEELDNGD